MVNGFKTLADIQTEEETLTARLAALESDLLKLHEKEWELRTELTHLMIQLERLQKLEPGSTS